MLRQLVINMVGPWLIRLNQEISMIVRPSLVFLPNQKPSHLNSLLQIQAIKHLVLPSFFQKKELHQFSLTLDQEVRKIFYVQKTLSMTSILIVIFVHRIRYYLIVQLHVKAIENIKAILKFVRPVPCQRFVQKVASTKKLLCVTFGKMPWKSVKIFAIKVV